MEISFVHDAKVYHIYITKEKNVIKIINTDKIAQKRDKNGGRHHIHDICPPVFCL